MFTCRRWRNGVEITGGSSMELHDGESYSQDEMEKFQKELLAKAVKDQNTLRLSSGNIDKTGNDKELATALFKLAEISFTIIKHIQKNPEKIFTARKFIEHYQDKAVMLSRKYSSMSEAASVVIDDEFINTKSNIRNVMISFVDVFNNEYKKITDTDHIDINAELAVLMEDMQQQGIEVSDIKEVDTSKSNERREKVQKIYDNIEERMDEIDLSSEEEKEDSIVKENRLAEVVDSDYYYTDPNHPMYGKSKYMDVERVLKEYCKDLSEAFDKRIPMSQIRLIQQDYAVFWYNHIATEKEKIEVCRARRTYVALALFPVTGIFSFHKQYSNQPSFVFRMVLFWTVIPYIMSLHEGITTLIGDDTDFLRGDGLDIFFNDLDWAKLVAWYDSEKHKRKIASHFATVYE